MSAWWNALNGIQQIFALFAIPSTLILVLQTLLLLFGLVGASDGDTSDADVDMDADADVDFDVSTDFDADVDADFDADFDADMDIEVDAGGASGGCAESHVFGGHGHSHTADGSLRLFTVRAFVAFFTIFGWTGMVLADNNVNTALNVAISIAAGFVSMIAMAYFFKFALSLQASGNIDMRNSLGKTASVYIPIPPERSGKGKINLVVDGRYIEAEAVTDHDSIIKTGTEVITVSVNNQGVICVEPAAKTEYTHELNEQKELVKKSNH